MDEAKNIKFGIRIDLGKSHLTHDKTRANGAWLLVVRDRILNFGTACISGRHF